MSRDKFFDQQICSRCPNDLKTRIQSWFNEDVICPACSEYEKKTIRRKLTEKFGNDFEGCDKTLKELEKMLES